MIGATVRRSARLASLKESSADDSVPVVKKKSAKKRTAPNSKKTTTKKATTNKSTRKASGSSKPKRVSKKKSTTTKDTDEAFLPRCREVELLEDGVKFVMGVDEAGRGPLAGPVVAAAAIVPTNIMGITDSKKIVLEAAREDLYMKIVNSPNVRWAVAIVDAQRIDEINILQATLQGMTMAADAVMNKKPRNVKQEASISHNGCYVVCGGELPYYKLPKSAFYALVDGNKVPKNISIEAEPMVKGDSREYSIAAASILAKVTRDRLMHAYHELYPQYNLAQHKGYPTAAHMKAVVEHGASPIHRRTFAPLKHMELD